jgi:hypothetical protein
VQPEETVPVWQNEIKMGDAVLVFEVPEKRLPEIEEFLPVFFSVYLLEGSIPDDGFKGGRISSMT